MFRRRKRNKAVVERDPATGRSFVRDGRSSAWGDSLEEAVFMKSYGDWEKLFDPSTGRCFFFHKVECVSQWERPSEIEGVSAIQLVGDVVEVASEEEPESGVLFLSPKRPRLPHAWRVSGRARAHASVKGELRLSKKLVFACVHHTRYLKFYDSNDRCLGGVDLRRVQACFADSHNVSHFSLRCENDRLVRLSCEEGFRRRAEWIRELKRFMSASRYVDSDVNTEFLVTEPASFVYDEPFSFFSDEPSERSVVASRPPKSSPPYLPTTSFAKPRLAVAVQTRTSASPEELSFHVGEYVVVIDRSSDEFWKARHVDTGQVGTFSPSLVEFVSNRPEYSSSLPSFNPNRTYEACLWKNESNHQQCAKERGVYDKAFNVETLRVYGELWIALKTSTSTLRVVLESLESPSTRFAFIRAVMQSFCNPFLSDSDCADTLKTVWSVESARPQMLNTMRNATRYTKCDLKSRLREDGARRDAWLEFLARASDSRLEFSELYAREFLAPKLDFQDSETLARISSNRPKPSESHLGAEFFGNVDFWFRHKNSHSPPMPSDRCVASVHELYVLHLAVESVKDVSLLCTAVRRCLESLGPCSPRHTQQDSYVVVEFLSVSRRFEALKYGDEFVIKSCLKRLEEVSGDCRTRLNASVEVQPPTPRWTDVPSVRSVPTGSVRSVPTGSVRSVPTRSVPTSSVPTRSVSPRAPRVRSPRSSPRQAPVPVFNDYASFIDDDEEESRSFVDAFESPSNSFAESRVEENTFVDASFSKRDASRTSSSTRSPSKSRLNASRVSQRSRTSFNVDDDERRRRLYSTKTPPRRPVSLSKRPPWLNTSPWD